VALARLQSDLQGATVIFSPDLKRILYARQIAGGAYTGDSRVENEIRIAQTAGGADDFVHHVSRFSALEWAPDGQHFVVQPAEPDQPARLWDSGSQVSTPLTDRTAWPVWVDATHFLFLSQARIHGPYGGYQDELRLAAVGQPGVLLAQPARGDTLRFDFTLTH
jgi:hypothetical protein